MDATVDTPEMVMGLPLNEREEGHKSRNRVGFHVYLSRFCMDFKALSEEEKRAEAEAIDALVVQQYFEGLLGYAEHDDSDDSVLTVHSDQHQIKHVLVMQLACSKWWHFSAHLKDGWKSRAMWLNSRPVPGKFSIMPDELNLVVQLDAMALD
eukprot:scaffold1989_cov39-Attheya_sp.AAC.1